MGGVVLAPVRASNTGMDGRQVKIPASLPSKKMTLFCSEEKNQKTFNFFTESLRIDT
jgi:hypothetical protein